MEEIHHTLDAQGTAISLANGIIKKYEKLDT
jgi:hypothetical protein